MSETGGSNSERSTRSREEVRSPSIIPRQYQSLIAKSQFFYRQYQTFSHKLAEAVTRGHLFDTDKYGRQSFRQMEEMLTQLDAQHITEFGKALGSILAGRKVIDLGCGNPAYSRVPPIVSRALGAREYLGVDIDIPDTYLQNGIPELYSPEYRASYVRADTLHFVAQLPPQDGVVFYLAGFEPVDTRDAITQQYIDACCTEMQRITQTGDAIVIGLGTIGFHPENYDFVLKQTATTINRYDDEMLSQQIYVRK